MPEENWLGLQSPIASDRNLIQRDECRAFAQQPAASGGHLSGPTSTELTMAITAAPEARPRRGEADGREAAARAYYESATGAQVVLARWPSALAASAARVAPDPEAAAVEPSSVFMLTSITKPATAMALLVLAEEGRLSLEDLAWSRWEQI